ncbi:MAG: hypothetical protein ACR2PR_08865 [Pseudohongiellaceae bacterium]
MDIEELTKRVQELEIRCDTLERASQTDHEENRDQLLTLLSHVNDKVDILGVSLNSKVDEVRQRLTHQETFLADFAAHMGFTRKD